LSRRAFSSRASESRPFRKQPIQARVLLHRPDYRYEFAPLRNSNTFTARGPVYQLRELPFASVKVTLRISRSQ
jgi:hypothetical protein